MGKSSKPQMTSGLSDPQKKVDKLLSTFFQSQLQNGTGATPYQGSLSPSLIPRYQESLKLLDSFNPGALGGAQQGAVLNLLSGKPSYQLDPQTTQNWFQNSVVNPSMQQFRQSIAPQIDSMFNGLAGFSSAQGFAKSQALGNLNVQNASALANAQMQNQNLSAQLAEGAAGRQSQGIQFASGLINEPFQQAQAYQQVLNPFQQQLIQQSDARYREFLRTSPENNPMIQQALGYINSSTQMAYPNDGGMLGGITRGAAITAMSPQGGPLGLFGNMGLGALGIF